jgi:hypothetical protein
VAESVTSNVHGVAKSVSILSAAFAVAICPTTIKDVPFRLSQLPMTGTADAFVWKAAGLAYSRAALRKILNAELLTPSSPDALQLRKLWLSFRSSRSDTLYCSPSCRWHARGNQSALTFVWARQKRPRPAGALGRFTRGGGLPARLTMPRWIDDNDDSRPKLSGQHAAGAMTNNERDDREPNNCAQQAKPENIKKIVAWYALSNNLVSP